MKFIDRIPILGRLIREDKGQALVFTIMSLTALLGVTGIAVDAGKGYYAFQMLKASTNAAVLAGAAGMPSQTTATTLADNYGSQTAAYNSNGIMTHVVTNPPVFNCNTTVTTNFGVECENSAGGSTGSTANTITVTQTAQVSTWIGPLFGVPTFNITDTATAAMAGGAAKPYNIAIILDTTASMKDSDSGVNSNCNNREACAQAGIQDLINGLVPGTSTLPVDQVSLYAFPGATSASLPNDYACNGTNPIIVPYGFTSATSLSSSTSQPTNYSMPSGESYRVISWSNDYKTSSGTVSSSSNLVKTTGGVSGCGAGDPGGEGTYYAQVIYQAGADLSAKHTLDGYDNILIILSDGDATACNSQAYPSNNCGSNPPYTAANMQIEAANCPQITTAKWTNSACSGNYSGQPLNGTWCSTSNRVTYPTCTTEIDPAGKTDPTFPSAIGQCGQAVIAAQWVSSLPNTQVFTFGYGTEKSGSCSSDSTYSATVNSSTSGYGAKNWAPGDQACDAMGAMATDANHFFSDNVNGCTATGNNAGVTQLKAMFQAVLRQLTTSRLIPNS